MTHPQPGIFALSNPENDILEIDLIDDHDGAELVRGLVNAVGVWSTRAGVTMVIGVRPGLWRAMHPESTPADAADFTEPVVGADGFTMPATQHDAWVWIAGPDRAAVFDAADALRRSLHGLATIASEKLGWHYKESRDLTGFVDGTENPGLLEAPAVVTVPQGRPSAGASVLLYQIWEHDLDAWTALTVPQQEDVIGRTKVDDVEMDEDRKPATSHVARTSFEHDGAEQQIFRRNLAYGDSGSHGTLFVGFSVDQWRQAEMLRRMAGVADGVRDALTRFALPRSGAYYVVPPASALAAYLAEEED